MKNTINNRKIFFVSPGSNSKGGISTFVDNYKKTNFWKEYDCYHYGSCGSSEIAIIKLFSNFVKLIIFPFILLLNKSQVVSIHCSSAGSFYRKALYVIISRIFLKKVVLHVHPTHFKNFYLNSGFILKKIIKYVLIICNAIVFLTREVNDFFLHEIPQLNTHILANPVDFSLFKNNFSKTFTNNYNITYLGWIIAEKGVFDIVDIIPEVVSEFPTVVFQFAGNKQINTLKSKIAVNRLEKNTKVLGWIDGKTKVDLLFKSRILLLPTYSEGIPNVLLEAMASKLPAITTPVGGIPSIFEEGVNGKFITPGNKIELKNAILELLESDKLCEEISQATYNSSINKFDIKIIGTELNSIYSKIFQKMGAK